MDDIWDVLFELAPIKRPTPPSTLYDVIVDTKDLATVKKYVAGGHSADQQFAGGQSVTLAISKGDLEFVKYFVEAATDLQRIHELVTQAVRRLSESSNEQMAEAGDILDYILELPLSESQLTSGYMFCAGAGQFSAARKILSAGLNDHDVQIGANEYQLLSERVAQLGNTEFAALLKGEPVDAESLDKRETKERRLNARLKNTLDDLVPFADQKVLGGAEFETRYHSLLEEVEAGKRDDELGSHDSRFGRSVLEFAAANGFVELVELVLGRCKESSKSPQSEDLQTAIAAATYGHLNVLEALQTSGVAVQETPPGSNSPLSEACRYGHYDVVCYLLEQGADPGSGDGSGHDLTLIDIAGGEGRSKIVTALEAGQA